jgi:SAM-dependent methyltransferase
MKSNSKDKNLNQKVIDGFGHEWEKYNYTDKKISSDLDKQFDSYVKTIDLSEFSITNSIACDFGAGSGRWTERFLPYFHKVYALEPSDGAFEVLKNKFATETKVKILKETIGANSLTEKSLDLAISLGVLHHLPDTRNAIKDISITLKPGGVFLCYLYYNLESKPWLYRILFKISNQGRKVISYLPKWWKLKISQFIAITIYWPLSRIARIFEIIGLDSSNVPLHHYSRMPFVMLANDALDRFGTILEQRFSKEEIRQMLMFCDFDLSTLKFSDSEPFYTFSIKRNGQSKN